MLPRGAVRGVTFHTTYTADWLPGNNTEKRIEWLEHKDDQRGRALVEGMFLDVQGPTRHILRVDRLP